MTEPNLAQLLEIAKQIEMNKQEQEQQRRSFAFGNTRIENRNITLEAIERAASVIAAEESQ